MARGGKFAVDLLINAKDNASKAVQGLTSRFGALGKAVAGIGAAIGTYFSGRAIVGFFKGAVSEAADLEKALSRVAAVTRAVPADMARLKAAAEEMGASTKFTAAEAASAMEALGRAGLGVDQTLQALPSVLALASGQSLELGESAKIVASAVAGMQMSFEESGRAADVLALAASSANTDVQGLSTAISYAAPNAKAAGIEIEELAAYIGTLANAGYDGSRAGTALSRMMAEFVNPASGMRNALAEVGITTDDFTEAMTQLQAKGDDALPVIVALGQRAGPALRTLLGQGIEGVKDLTGNLRNAEGAAKAASDRMQDNLAGAITSLKSAWSAFKIVLVDPLLEPITEQVRRLTERIRTLATDGSLDKLRESLVRAFENAVTAVEGLVTELGGLDGALDRINAAVTSTLDFFSKLAAAGRLTGNIITAAFLGIQAAIAAPLTLISAALTAIMGGINAVGQGLNRLGRLSDENARKLENVFVTMQESTVRLGQMVGNNLIGIGEQVGNAAENFQALGSAMQAVEEPAKRAATATKSAAEESEKLARHAKEAAEGVFTTAESFDAWAASMEEATEAANEVTEATDDAAVAMAALRAGVAAAEDRLRELVAAGADMEDITEATEELTAAQRRLAEALGETADESGETKKAFDQIVASIKAITFTTENATRVDAWRNLNLAASELERQFKAGALTVEEYAAASEILREKYDELRFASMELKAENRELSDSFREVADAAEATAERVAAVRQGYRLADPKQISDLETLIQMLRLAEETSRNVARMGQGRESVQMARDYEQAVRERLEELQAQTAEAKREVELTRASNDERETRQTRFREPAEPVRETARRDVNIDIRVEGGLLDAAAIDRLARQLRPALEDIIRRSA
jgi:TP901 family phage tail tape measure protein